MSVIAALDTC